MGVIQTNKEYIQTNKEYSTGQVPSHTFLLIGRV